MDANVQRISTASTVHPCFLAAPQNRQPKERWQSLYVDARGAAAVSQLRRNAGVSWQRAVWRNGQQVAPSNRIAMSMRAPARWQSKLKTGQRPSRARNVGLHYGFTAQIINDASAGVIGATIAALLAAFTEPVLNRVMGRRMTIKEAWRDVKLGDIMRYFRTTLGTNLFKFPFFEAVNTITYSLSSIPVLVRGVVAAVIYTSAMLPLANYRYAMSLQMEVRLGMLYQAYWPTLLRDVIYGITRTQIMAQLIQADPLFAATTGGRSINTFIAVAVACICSAPGNELRAYHLQPKETWLPPAEFFKVARFLRSTLFGAGIVSVSLGLGQLFVGEIATMAMYWLKPLMPLLLALWCMDGVRVVSAALAAIGLVKLEKATQYYDQYAQPRALLSFRSKASKTRSRSKRQAQGKPKSEKSVQQNPKDAAVPTTATLARFVAPAF